MKNAAYVFIAGTVVLATVAGAAYAAPGKSREQVQKELAAALQAGDVRTGFQGLSPRELNPDLYPAVPARPGMSRAQVQAQLDAALQTGSVVTGFQGLSPRELNPDLYPLSTSRSVAHNGAKPTGTN